MSPAHIYKHNFAFYVFVNATNTSHVLHFPFPFAGCCTPAPELHSEFGTRAVLKAWIHFGPHRHVGFFLLFFLF
jgi:hypothetical protein